MSLVNLSVVVPTLNEATHLAATLESVPGDVETVVSDGGSVDETVAIASCYGARVVEGPPGRATQLNRGAQATTGDAILFVHADCTLGPRAYHAVAAALENDEVVGGSFRLAIRDASWALKLIAMTSNARARYLKTPYGDQAIFVRRAAFETLGGFPEIAFMEDVALVRKLKKLGELVHVDETVTTDSRHWEHLGLVGTTLLNWTMVTLFLMGVSPDRLERHYRRLRKQVSRSKSENALSIS